MVLGSKPTPADRKWSQPALTPVRLFSLIAFCATVAEGPGFSFFLVRLPSSLSPRWLPLTPSLLIAKGAEGGVLASSKKHNPEVARIILAFIPL